MVGYFKKYMVLGLLLLGLVQVNAQSVWADIRLNKSEAFVGEPIELTIDVNTSTWFTEGVDIGNIKINGAFTVYFRSVSASKVVNGKTIASVQLLYNVFPFEEEDIVIPSLDIEVETPPEGGYKGKKRIVKSPEKRIRVKPFPPGVDKNAWMVTSRLSVNDEWSTSGVEIKVGEVLERKITRSAQQTLSELIPPIQWDSISGVSLYPTRSSVTNNKSKTAISAKRTDGVRYLFEKEGTVGFPDMELVWWHPYQKKMYKSTLKGKTVTIVPNPDLEVVKTAKESLLAESLKEEEEVASAPWSFLGFSWKEWAVILIVGLIVLIFIIKYATKIITNAKKNREAYLLSESYAFKEFIRAIPSKNKKKIAHSLYHWLDHISMSEPTLAEFAHTSKYEALHEEIRKLNNHIGMGKEEPLILNKSIWKAARKSFFQHTRFVPQKQTWINPT